MSLSAIVLLTTLIVFSAAGGWLGWRRGTLIVMKGTLTEPSRPADMSREQYIARLGRRRRRQRLTKTFVFGFAGMLAGLVLLLFLQAAGSILRH